MKLDEQYVREQDRKRFSVLKAIYIDSKGDRHQATKPNDICQMTGICGEELLHILEFLEKQALIKPIGTLYAMYGGTACVQITHQGMCEVEEAIKNPNESTKNFPAQVFHNTFNAPLGVFQQAGHQNTANVNQTIGFSEIDDLVAQLSDLIKSSPLPELDKEDAVEAANRLPELAKKEQSSGVIERVKQRLELINNTLKPVQEIYTKAKPILSTIYQLIRLKHGG